MVDWITPAQCLSEYGLEVRLEPLFTNGVDERGGVVISSWPAGAQEIKVKAIRDPNRNSFLFDRRDIEEVAARRAEYALQGNRGEVFNISNATYAAWKGDTYSANTAPLDSVTLQAAMNSIAKRGK